MKVAKENAQPKKKNVSSVVLIVLIVLLGAMFLFCGYKVFSIIREYKVAEKMYEGLNDKYVSSAPAGSTADKDKDSEEKPEDDGLDPEVSPVNIDFDTLLADCADIVGWLHAPNTVINYPVVQAEDNDKYLHHFIDGTYNPSGTLFFDCLCESDLSSTNTILYGHHMNDGTMLASICNYSSQSYYDAHPVMYLNTPTQNYRIEVFSAYITDPGAVSYTIEFGEDYTMENFLQEVRYLSDFSCNVEVSPEDHIITLSTCTYEYYNARYVVHGKLVPIH